MQAIQVPVDARSSIADINNLQDALALFLQKDVFRLPDVDRRSLEEGLRAERQTAKFGDVTRKLVERFQGVRHLQGTGVVDESTAKAMNGLLREFGELDVNVVGLPELLKVLDTQTRALTALTASTDRLAHLDLKIDAIGKSEGLAPNTRGDAVKNLHAQLASIGVVLPTNETAESIFGTGTRDALLQFQEKYEISKSGLFDDATRNALDIAVGNITHPSRIEGRIFLENGLPATKVKLRIFNKGFGDAATSLGDVETDDRGFYALPYNLNGAAANLELHSVDANNETIKLSDPKWNADRNEVLNLVAPSSVKTLASEFSLMASDLRPHLSDDLGKLALALETGDRQDISMLHQSTGWDARLVATAANAAKASAVTLIAHDALYGVLRAGLPQEPEALALVSPAAFETALSRASKAGIITLDDTQKIAANAAFVAFAIDKRRTMVVPGALSSVGDMLDKLGTARLESVHKNTFQKLVLMHEGDDESLWRLAKEQGIPDAQISNLQLQGKLAYLTLNNAPLADSLQNEIATHDGLSQLVEKDLYQPEQWITRLDKMATENGELNPEKLSALIPTAYTHQDVNLRRDAYAKDLAQKVRQTFPTNVVSRRIERDELKLGTKHADLKVPVQMFLKNAVSKGFQLGRVNVDQFIQQQDDSLFEGISKDKATEGIKLLSRAYQMTPNDEAMMTVLDLGFTSARQLISIPKEDFVERYWERFGDKRTTEMVWEKSSQITSVTFNVFTMAKTIDSAPPMQIMAGSADRQKADKENLKGLLKDYPTMESLFGSMDFCECEHCRSVLSPAAYMVDLLRFIDPSTQEWKLTLEDWKNKHSGKAYDGLEFNFLKPYDALFLRRPDLPNLPLTCENTNTVLPYIDLVNEILEYYVANNTLDPNAVRDTGDASSEGLMAEPQNVIPEAYDILKSARYPLSLPFDLWLETTRRFCAYFETPFWHLLDVFRPSDELFVPAPVPAAPARYYRAEIFSEYLGVSPDEYAIYTSDSFADWPKLYGFDESVDTPITSIAALTSAKLLSQRLGVSYKELVALLQTNFINPNLKNVETARRVGLSVSDVVRFKNLPIEAKQTEEQKLDAAEIEKRLKEATTKYKTAIPVFNASKWLNDTWNTDKFSDVLVLHDEDVGCSFDSTLLVYADSTEPSPLDFVRLNLFVRLWKRLGWTIKETDLALEAFVPAGVVLTDTTLGGAMKTAFVYISHLKELESLVSVGKNGRMKLLTLWGNLPTTGANSLYSQLFLTRSILKDDAVFDHPLGMYLSATDIWIKDHLPSLQSALGLTSDEMTQILQDGGTGDEANIGKAKLSIANVSVLYRYGMLAKALKITIGDLISLKVVSGLNPFHALAPNALTNINEDFALQHTLTFVNQALQIKNCGVAISELDYLFRHRFDPVGKYAPDKSVDLAWLQSLATSLQSISNEHALPTDLNNISDEFTIKKLSLGFAPEAIDLLLNKKTYSATMIVPENQQLSASVYQNIENTTFLYDKTRTLQTIKHVGVMTEAEKAKLIGKVSVPPPIEANEVAARAAFSEMLDNLIVDSKKQFEATIDERDKYLGQSLDFDSYFALTVDEKRKRLLTVFLPFFQLKKTRQAITEALSSRVGSDTALIELLIAQSEFLNLPDDPTKPLSTWFEGLSKTGISVEFFGSSEPNLTPLRSDDFDDANLKADPNIDSARWQAHLKVPKGGAYRFYAKLSKKDAKVSIQIEGISTPVLVGAASVDNDELSEFVELKAETLYALTITASNLQGGAFELSVKGETSAKGSLKQFLMMPSTSISQAKRAYLLLSKAVTFLQTINLTSREARHILTYPSEFGNLNLRSLPVHATDANATALFTGFLSLYEYDVLKREFAGDGEGLVAIMEQARLTNPPDVAALCIQLANLTRRMPSVVQDIATQLQMTAVLDFSNVRKMTRLCRALLVVEKFGLQMATLAKWLTPKPDAVIAMNVRHAIKARYEPDAWQRVAKSIFDPLRQLQRDALVAHITHLNPELLNKEKLFEYFLIDPGTEPVVQTSRLRLAISSLQTFIQRCFLNLEKQVHPSILNARHWAWMKRYRVWEANRKIFLFPENWLEPEWRDDKTHLYQELESSLLQGDVSNQLAENALFVYLKKLDQLARLEIVTMYAEEKVPGPPTIHVVGRTHAQPRQYFYRRYAHQMWTPWEPVTSEIDGDHIVAAMWRDRLHLFWLTFMEKVEETSNTPFEGVTDEFAKISAKAMFAEARKTVKRTLDIQLNWSEYVQGEWSTRESSGFGNTLELNSSFNAGEVKLHVSNPDAEDAGKLLIHINLNKSTTPINQPGFQLISKNARPKFGLTEFVQEYPGDPYNESHNQFYVRFKSEIVTNDGKTSESVTSKTILMNANSLKILPASNQMRFPNKEFAPLISPFFYSDERNTFFVEPSLTETTVDRWEGYTITRPSQTPNWKNFINFEPKLNVVIPPKYSQEALKLSHSNPLLDPVDKLGLLAIKPNLDFQTQPTVAVRLGESLIGSSGLVREALNPEKSFVLDGTDNNI